MICLVCGTELTDGEAICGPCAISHIREEWFSDREGYFRLRSKAELVSVLDDGQFHMTLGGETMDERIAELPETVEGYRTARRLMHEVMDEYSRGDNVQLPRYSHVARSLVKLERYDELFPEECDRSLCNSLASLYYEALKSFTLPFAPADFIDERKRVLKERADYWLRRGGGEGDERKVYPLVPGPDDAPESDSDVRQEPRQAGQDADALRLRIRAMEQQIAELRRVVPAGTAVEHETDAITITAVNRITELREKIESLEEKVQRLKLAGEGENIATLGSDSVIGKPVQNAPDRQMKSDEFVRMRKRITVSMLIGESRDAFKDSFELLQRGSKDGKDFETAILLALKMNDPDRLKSINELAPRDNAEGLSRLAQAVFAWKNGKWGSAIQLADDEMEQTGSSAAFLLKMNICRQYGLTDGADELDEQRGKVKNMAAGAELLSRIYLQLDMWGAAIQCLSVLPEHDWTDAMWADYGMAMEQKGTDDSAMEAYDRSLQLNGLNVTSTVRKALLLSANGRNTESEELLKNAVELWPSVARVRASILEAIGKREYALQLLKEAAREDSEDVKIVRAGISISAKLGKRKDRKYFASLLSTGGAVQ